ncbi:MAG TPA: hypoxanthine phosphoribosyltransferase [Roseiflexaceae bacterium]|nr:hypoxanthine phosphoribosyltransferase [Roseiflexaceae bacterium]
MESLLVARVRAWFAEAQPLPHGAVLLVGVSGGADSLCLLHVLAALREPLGFRLHAAHLNHQLRGADSDADAAFVLETARAWGVPATAKTVDIQAYAQAHRLNLHHAAREVRYRWFADLAHAHNAAAVAVAHTANDQAETVLMHLLRGAGSTGLRGMAAVSAFTPEKAVSEDTDEPESSTKPLYLLRPLLTTTRAEIEEYCRDHGLQPRQDATNADLYYTRNRIRHELLPQLATFNPNIIASLGRTAAIAAEEHDFLQQRLDNVWPTLVRPTPEIISFDGSIWRTLHPALQRAAIRRAYQRIVSADTLAWERLEQARQTIGRAGRRVELPGHVWLVTDNDDNFTIGRAYQAPVQLHAPQLAGDNYPLAIPGHIALANGWVLTVDHAPALQPPDSDGWQIDLDADVLTEPLVLRRRRPGDRIQLTGGHGHRKLQDLFVDAKVPQPLRAAWPVIATERAIMWMPGLKAAARYVATPQTHSIIRIRLYKTHVEDYMKEQGMHADIDHILLSEEVIQARVKELGAQITATYAEDDNLLLVGVLKGCAMFMVDLARAIDLPLAIDFMAISSYGGSRESSGVVRLLKDLDTDIADRHVLIVEDIIDSGLTIEYLRSQLQRRNPASLRVCSLLNKPERRATAMAIDFLGFDIPNEFVVGYGLDYAEQYRNLPYIGVLKEEIYTT